ncbi:uncharacterized protein BX663DRAFT_440080 [Cokeromyces recurvatus]|uniref:uncharacterized protein n=1 Tax=Cokeromyces recurvatus TaxID=90255 RepID=UPI00221EE91A|nr:uncharacterized protein BX663DRAFT_440080 [Cokeromyces recurvatus]KAI7899934.1 hypothetical protein BX663DRAFT_440080 [Cokeromyces recurvatus]
MIELRLEKFVRDKFAFIQQSNELDYTSYHLIGVLMVSRTQGKTDDIGNWCLYLRDYFTEGESVWRVFVDDSEMQISSEQVMADIRDSEYNQRMPNTFSKAFRPLYLFYGNYDILLPTENSNSNIDNENRGPIITLDDYTFDDEYYDEFDQQPDSVPEEENEQCMHCGIRNIIEDVNDMFFCESCNRGVHQLCEDPPIQVFEKDIDPWFCRTCSRAKNLPIPTQSSDTSLIQWGAQDKNDSNHLLTKRKREDNNSLSTIIEETDINHDNDIKKVIKKSI